MSKQIIRQGPEITGRNSKNKPVYKDPKKSYVWYDDGSKEPLEEYRARQPKKEKPPRYDLEEQREREKLISKIFKYDKASGMHYDPEKGFIRDSAGRIDVSLEAAIITYEGVTTSELRRTVKEIENFEAKAVKNG